MYMSVRCPLTSRTPRKKTPASEKRKIPRSTFEPASSIELSQKRKSLGLSDELYVTALDVPVKPT